MTDKEAPPDERAKFEAAMREQGIEPELWLAHKPEAGYANPRICDYWFGWMARSVASPSLPLPGMQWSETAAIHAAHAAGFAGESWFMGPEELAHLLTLAHPAGQQEKAVLSDLDRGLLEQALVVMVLAKHSHGHTMLSDPPQEAWKFNRVNAKIDAAIAAIRSRLPSGEKS